MNKLYCSECGMTLKVHRKAIKGLGRIVEIVEPHICLDEPIQPDFSIDPAPPYVKEPKGKFVQILNELKPGPGVWPEPALHGASEGFQPPFPKMVGTDDLRDRRTIDYDKSTAPLSILRNIGSMSNALPTNNLQPERSESINEEEPTNEE